MTAGRLAFVPPRYGNEIVGGSEAVMREAAHGLARRGWEVEVLTTCARDHYTWENAYPAGTTTDDDVVVHRFPIERSRTKRSAATQPAAQCAGGACASVRGLVNGNDQMGGCPGLRRT